MAGATADVSDGSDDIDYEYGYRRAKILKIHVADM